MTNVMPIGLRRPTACDRPHFDTCAVIMTFLCPHPHPLRPVLLHRLFFTPCPTIYDCPPPPSPVTLPVPLLPPDECRKSHCLVVSLAHHSEVLLPIPVEHMYTSDYTFNKVDCNNLRTPCRHTIQKYRCPRCERNYTSLDIASFPIREFGFQCGECNDQGYDVSLHESFHSQDGAMIDVKEKDLRVAAAKAMLVIPAAA